MKINYSRRNMASGLVGYLLVFAITAIFLTYISYLTGGFLSNATSSYYNNEGENLASIISTDIEKACLYVSEYNSDDSMDSSQYTQKVSIPELFQKLEYTVSISGNNFYFNTTTSLSSSGIISISKGINTFGVQIVMEHLSLNYATLYIYGIIGGNDHVYVGGS